MVVLSGYIDESYDGKDYPDDFTLCCIMASANDWKNVVSPLWRGLFARVNEQLAEQGRQHITRYKAAACNGSHDEFEGWAQQEKVELTKYMSSIFDHTEIKPSQMGYSVRLSKIHQKLPSVKDPKAFAYAMLFLLIIKGILEMMETLPEGSTIAFIHDRSDYDMVYLSVFNTVLGIADEQDRKRLTTIVPMANENCPPLEVADLIAYENYKHHINKIGGKSEKRTIDYLLQDDRLGGRSSVILDEQFEIADDELEFLKWCSSFGGKRLRYPEIDAKQQERT